MLEGMLYSVRAAALMSVVGFDLALGSFGGCHSIQLSYERDGAQFTADWGGSPIVGTVGGGVRNGTVICGGGLPDDAVLHLEDTAGRNPHRIRLSDEQGS
jgi:hypothetical protein